LAKVILNQKKYFEPGETGFAQLRFKEPLSTYLRDRFILRIPSPPKTIGGGLIIDPLAHKHHFKDKDILHFLQKRIKFDFRELVLTELKKNIFIKKDNLLINSNYTDSEIREVVELLKKEGEIITTNSRLIDKNYWQRQIIKFMNRLNQEYELYPLQTGFPLNKFQSYFYHLKPEIFKAIRGFTPMAKTSLKALAAAICPKVYGSSTIGVIRSRVKIRACLSFNR